MKTQPLGCMSSMMLKEIDQLCPGLEQLKLEHIPLTRQMEDFYELTQLMEEKEIEATHENLQQLYKQVTQFVTELEPHSEREEGILFEMVAAYIGRETGPIAVMEYEHDQAKNHLRQFLVQAAQAGAETDVANIRAIADHAAKAYLILSEHFMKEENVLFPLAEQFLSPDEKQELEVKIKSIV
ncbi:hemerythrin domain-containing protein [Alkalihalobacterium chitinilyticum]|uniref:Hemerythrin domain-containing protein n=1 Tax=Alkalihalobacterium chitinilyticum TaxID=2980103 RepID=A0ABT5VIV8_9BACI|nr:hemerythrin domain-containing protein [Alkalihalobacterium chitinilyticum]MDE5415387.1 hemerythrin domain-containing protein [Alkalihalobacterium chitinilyticum]